MEAMVFNTKNVFSNLKRPDAWIWSAFGLLLSKTSVPSASSADFGSANFAIHQQDLSTCLPIYRILVMPLIALIIFSACSVCLEQAGVFPPFLRHPGARSNLFLELGLDYRNIKINVSQGFSDVLLILSNFAR
jgi:hypothetical protein